MLLETATPPGPEGSASHPRGAGRAGSGLEQHGERDRDDGRADHLPSSNVLP